MALRPPPDPGATIACRDTGPAPGSLDGVREAVTTATRRLAMLPGPPFTGWGEVGTVLDDLVLAVSPVHRTVRALREVDPSGELAAVVNCLAAAAWHLDAGDVVATRATIAAGATAMDRYLMSAD